MVVKQFLFHSRGIETGEIGVKCPLFFVGELCLEGCNDLYRSGLDRFMSEIYGWHEKQSDSFLNA